MKCFSKRSGNWKDEEKKTERAFFKTQAWFSTKEDSTICSSNICKRKKGWRLLLFLRQVTSYRENGRRLSEKKRRWTMYKNNDVKRICRDTKNIILIKWRLLACAKDAISQEQRQVKGQRWRTEQKLLEAYKKIFWGNISITWQEKID